MIRVGFAVVAVICWHSAGGSEALYFPCQSCHGAAGQGNEALGAPAIAGMDADYLAAQMVRFRDGDRGATLADLPGRQMSLIAATYQRDEEVRSLAQYVATMPVSKPLATLPPPAGNVSQLYASCAVCHGTNGEGVAGLNGPPIAWLDDWYVERQLQNYKTGLRGSDPRNTGGLQMSAAVAVYSDADFRQLAAYVATLSGESSGD